MTLTRGYVIANSDRVNNDYYPTPPIAVQCLLNNSDVPQSIWEPAAGRGHISKELIRCGRTVVSTDLFSYEDCLVPVEPGRDLLTTEMPDVDGVVTNPPFKKNLPEALVRRMTAEYGYVAIFSRITFMESHQRHGLFTENPPSDVIVLSQRVNCYEDFLNINHGIGGMIAYAWYVWDDRRLDKGKLTWCLPSSYIGKLQ